MLDLPGNIVVIPGPGSATGIFLYGIGVRPDWEVMHTDFWFTGDELTRRVQEQMADGKRAFVNLDPCGWERPDAEPFEWHAVSDMASRFRRAPGPEPFVELLPKENKSVRAPLTTAEGPLLTK